MSEFELRHRIEQLERELRDARRRPGGDHLLEQLEAGELRYRRIVENTADGVWMYDAAGITTYMNPRMAELVGCPLDQAVGQRVLDYMDEAARHGAEERLARRRQGLAERAEFRLLRRDGTDVWVSVHANPLFDASGHLDGVLALVTDITDRRKADALRNQLAAIVSSSDDAIISRGTDGLIRTWNRGAERLTGYSAEGAIGQPTLMLFGDDQRPVLERMREQLDRDGVVPATEAFARRKDGSRVEVSFTAAVLTDDAGQPTGVSIIARDISARRRTEAALKKSQDQLRQAQKLEAIGGLAGGVAHDFNNLLTVILSYSSMAMGRVQTADPLRNELTEVQKAAERAAELTHQLLAFSRQQVLQPEVVDLNQVVLGVERMLSRLLHEDVQLSLLTSAKECRVHADRGQLEQVIMNLVVNACDAMPTGGNLSIETSTIDIDEGYAAEHHGIAPGAYVMLAVTDTGTGMDAATRERIFEPFFTTKDKSKGTGLGLATVYGIVQQSGGHIWVYSEPGKGSTFKVYLPLTDRTLSAPTPTPPTAAVGGSETILLVEDEEQVRVVMRSVLRANGYNVLEAQNGGEAFLVCEQFTATIHLLLTDVVMPRMSGRQLAERLSKLRPDMKVLFVSGYTDDTIVHHGVLEAGIEFLQKPVMPGALLRKLRQVLDAPPRARPAAPPR